MRITTKRLIFLAYFLTTFILNRLASFSFSWTFLSYSLRDLVLWFLGAFLGGYFIKLEQVVYAQFIHPNEPLSIEIRSLIKQKQNKEVWRLLRSRVAEQKLAFRSAVFQAVWVILAFFTLTSTNSILGKTLVMAIGLHLLLDEWEAVKKKQGINWLFWQIKRVVSPKEQHLFLYLISSIFIALTLLLI